MACSGQVTSFPSMSDYSTPISSEAAPESQFTIIQEWDFEGEQLGGWSDGEITAYFTDGITNFNSHNEVGDTISHIVVDNINGVATQVLRFKHRQGEPGVGGVGEGFQMIARNPNDFTELYWSYNFRDGVNMNSNAGGKMPGFRGTQSTDCPIVSGSGYLAMLLFKRVGAISSYHKGRSGFGCPWATDQDSIVRNYGNYYNITGRVVLNDFTTGTPNANGLQEVWIDGVSILQETGLTIIEDEADTFKINSFTFSSYYGGDGASFTPTIDVFTYIDNVKIYLPDNDETLGTRNLHDVNEIIVTPDIITDRDFYFDTEITSAAVDMETASYPTPTPLHTNQRWLIDAGPGNTVQIDFTDGRTSGGDYLLFYNGNTTDSDELARKVGSDSDLTDTDFGFAANGRVTSDTRYMFVSYVTDFSIDWGFFNANVTFN